MVVMGILASSIYGIFITTEIALEAAGVSKMLDLQEEQFRTERAI
jgi:hypothetical protein